MKNLALVIKILFVIVMVAAGFYFGMVSQNDEGPAVPPDTTYIYIPVPADTITMPGEIKYIYQTDTLFFTVPAIIDSVASVDTTFADKGRLEIDYYYRDQLFSIFRKAPPIQIKEITNTVIEYRTKKLRWYDGIGFGFGYDLIGKTATINVGYSINIGNLRGI